MTFGHLTHTMSANTVWDVRVGRFVFNRDDDPSTGEPDDAEPVRRAAPDVQSGAPQTFGGLILIRTTVKGTLNHYQPRLLGADHQWRIGGQLEKGEHQLSSIIPTGVRYRRHRRTAVSGRSRSDPSIVGGAVHHHRRVRQRRHHRGQPADDQRRTAVRPQPRHQSGSARCSMHRGTRPTASSAVSARLYTWNVWSPRLGVTTKLTADGRTMLRASYGRFNQGVLTGELAPFHPGATPTTTVRFDPATGGYTSNVTGGRSEKEPAVRSRDADAAHRRVLRRRRSRDRSRSRGGDRLRSQGWRQLHRLDRCRRPVSRGDADAARWPQPCRCSCSSTPRQIGASC